MRTQTSKHPTNLPHLTDDDRSRPSPIDYGPALDAIGSLCKWAFSLAEKDVADWPEGRRRVRAARRHLLRSLGGDAAAVPTDDLLFTAGLLARIFESELRLPCAAVVRMLRELDLPTEVVPRVVQRPTPWTGPIRRYPTVAPRTAEEEDVHWLSVLLGDEYDDEVEIEDELQRRRAAVSVRPISEPCGGCIHARTAA
jgi:hypothetical protein